MAFLPERSRLVVLFWNVEVPLLLAIWGDRPPGSAQDFSFKETPGLCGEYLPPAELLVRAAISFPSPALRGTGRI